MALLEIKNVTKDYRLGKTVVHALRNINFSVNAGEFLSVVGPSGCGKTTLLNIIGCIDKPTDGTVLFRAEDITDLSDDEEADKRLKKMGFIFQSFNLIPVLSIFENVEFPLILNKTKKSERKERVEHVIEVVSLTDFVFHKPDELSAGQRQRVAIARALVNSPEVVIADEPTANLDSETGNSILEEMMRLNKEEEVTFIFSTHDPEIMKYAGRLIRLKDGMIEKSEESINR